MTLAEQIARIIDPTVFPADTWGAATPPVVEKRTAALAKAEQAIAIVRDASHIILCPQCEGDGCYIEGPCEDVPYTLCPRCLGDGSLIDIRNLGSAS